MVLELSLCPNKDFACLWLVGWFQASAQLRVIIFKRAIACPYLQRSEIFQIH